MDQHHSLTARKNKQTWVEEIGVAGFNFFVCPDAFITHVNHNNDKQDDRCVVLFFLWMVIWMLLYETKSLIFSFFLFTLLTQDCSEFND